MSVQLKWLMELQIRPVFRACLFLGLTFSANVWADQAIEVKQVVEQNVKSVLATFEEKKSSFETDPEGFYQDMEGALTKIVDFRRIAARVMGKHARKASKEQRNRFVEVFKSSLFDSYSKTLVNSGSFNITVLKAKINPRSDKRASVEMEVVSDKGNSYPVTYSMFRNKEDIWLVENVIVFGVNIGLAFKDRFEAQMRVNKGDVDKVIDGWTVDIGIDLPEEV
jgi:phospholipid transport system substrate-binding protein